MQTPVFMGVVLVFLAGVETLVEHLDFGFEYTSMQKTNGFHAYLITSEASSMLACMYLEFRLCAIARACLIADCGQKMYANGEAGNIDLLRMQAV